MIIDLTRERRVIASFEEANKCIPRDSRYSSRSFVIQPATFSNSANYQPHQELTLLIPFSSVFSLSFSPSFFLLFTFPPSLSRDFPSIMLSLSTTCSIRSFLRRILFYFSPSLLSLSVPSSSFLSPRPNTINIDSSTSLTLHIILFYLPSSLPFTLLIFFHLFLIIVQILSIAFSPFFYLNFLSIILFHPRFALSRHHLFRTRIRFNKVGSHVLSIP